MKILFLLTYYRPYWTGLTKYAARVAEAMVEDGHDVNILCTRHKGELKSKEEINGVKVYRSSVLFRVSRSQASLELLIGMVRYIKNTDVIFVYLPYAEVLFAVMLAKIFNKRIYLVHNGDLLLPRGLLNTFIDKFYVLVTRLAIKYSDRVVIQTKDYAQSSRVLSGLECKWEEILPLCEFMKATEEQVRGFRKKYNLEGKMLIGFSGRFVKEKGVEFLLKAIPLVTKKIPKAHFIFAGDYKVSYEDYWSKIAHLVDDNKNVITLLGLITDRGELSCFYSSLDVLVISSRKDCFPSSQIEAMMCEVPVVCVNIPGARWMVKNTGMGELVKAEDYKQIAKAIVRVLKNSEDYVKFRSKVFEVINSEKTIARYLELVN